MGDDERDSSPPIPAVPASETQWLVATHHRGGDSERIWSDYANRSRPGHVRFMNDTPYPFSRPVRPARLSTLGPAATSLGRLPASDRVVLVMMMHGIPQLPYIAGRLHSARNNPPLDLAAMSGDPSWDPPYLMFGWPQRLSNRHYQAVVSAIREMQRVRQVHIYGCRIGQPTFISALGDFTRDVGKEVWVYTGRTHTWVSANSQFLRIVNVSDDASHAQVAAAPDSDGVKEEGSGFRRVTLRTPLGTLPGWQMRGRPVGSGVEVDLLGTDMGMVVQTFRPFDPVPIRTVRVTT